MKREKIDLVVISTRAHVGMLRFFFSDNADVVIQQVDIPVLLIHPKG
ncbi:MAG: universal stress protein [Anaerolineales bacterium]|nr:universal stress protein [Anaerolineales bacterium]